MMDTKSLSSLIGGFIAIGVMNAMLHPKEDNEDNEDNEYENLSGLEIEDIDLDKKLNIKRLINEEGELI